MFTDEKEPGFFEKPGFWHLVTLDGVLTMEARP